MCISSEYMAPIMSVISSEYCVSKAMDITIDTGKGVTYINDKVVFRVKEPSFSLHHRRVLRDVSEKPILTLYKKHTTIHGRWQVFKNDSTSSEDLLFSVKRSTFKIPHKKNIDLEVFLAENTKEHIWDYKVNAGADKSSCDICAYGSSDILAKMSNSGALEVEVQPNVDYAFIVALLTIVDEINTFDKAANTNNNTNTASAADKISATAGVAQLGVGIAQLATQK